MCSWLLWLWVPSGGRVETVKTLAGDVAGRLILDAGCGSGPLHYLEDWGSALAELRRVFKPGGRLIVSINQPFAENLWHREAGLEPDYFATYNYTAEWTAAGQTALLCFWTRPLHAMTDAFIKAGFRIMVISEPAVAPDTPRELLPDDIADRRRFQIPKLTGHGISRSQAGNSTDFPG